VFVCVYMCVCVCVQWESVLSTVCVLSRLTQAWILGLTSEFQWNCKVVFIGIMW